MSNFYQEELLEHYKYPHNKKDISNPDFSAGEDNPSCGDQIFIAGIINNNKVSDIGFSGKGCVISQATTSMLTELCLNKNISDILALTDQDLLDLIGIALGPVRLKCATLSLQVLHKGLATYQKK